MDNQADSNPYIGRLNEIFSALGTTSTRFGNEHGINRQTIYYIMKGRNTPSLSFINQICMAEPRISPEYILNGEGAPLRNPDAHIEKEKALRLIEMEKQLQFRIEELENEIKQVQATLGQMKELALISFKRI